ncbi:MAG: hypothetical protein LBN98_07205 [Prevotellaceae bacterium]|jgi:beta-N-acetylhexosaminidase|nr:hypothetical protein [Prevotellaceae bacterium]
MQIKKHLLITVIGACAALQGCTQTGDAGLKEKIAQMLLVGFRDTTLTENSEIYHDIKELKVGGVILFDYDVPSKTPVRNIKSPAQVKKLVADLQQIAPVKLLVSIDQEGGKVNRLKPVFGFPPSVSAKYLGAADNADTTAFYAAQTAGMLAELGINLNFAPCVDVDVNPGNPIIGQKERSFSADPEKVAEHAGIWVAEQSKRHIISCPKHFPGHGSSMHDTHAGSADITNTWSAAELIPYRRLLQSGAISLIMTSHVFNANLDAEYPATMSKKILTGLLREELGFDGVIISDDLAMGAIADLFPLETALEKAINAGVDILCLSNNGSVYKPHMTEQVIDTIYALVKSGKITPERIDESYRRIRQLKQDFL